MWLCAVFPPGQIQAVYPCQEFPQNEMTFFSEFTAGAQDMSHWWCESWSPGHAGLRQVSPPKRKKPIPLCRWEIFCGETLGGLSHYLPFLRSSLTNLGNGWLSPEFTTTVLIAQWCFLFPSFCHTFINWRCATRKSFSFPLIRLFIHSFTWPGLCLLLSLFTLMLKLSQIWKAPANCLLCPIKCTACILWILSYFSGAQDTLARLYFPCLSSGISHCSKECWFLLEDGGI